MLDEYKYGVDYSAYNKDLIESMYENRVMGIPISFYILDLRKTNTFCYQSTALLSYIIPNSIQCSGEDKNIIGKDKNHFWVEADDIVLDTTMGLMWNKEKYYEHNGIVSENVTAHSEDEVMEYLSKYLRSNENVPEMYLAWIEDMNMNMDRIIYGKYLKDHIKRFFEEKELDKVEIDKNLVQEYLKELKKIYDHIDEFIQGAKEEEESER